jgi:hypothetical protein
MHTFGNSFVRTALLLALVASAVATSYGRSYLQTGSDAAVLAAGNPPLTREMSDQIREVFEWLLEARFTPTQCEQFQQLLTAEWQKASGKGNEVFLGYLKLRSQLAEATPEQRDAARGQIRPKVVEALYQPPVDAMSRLLIAVHESKQNKLDQVSGGPPQGAPAPVSNNAQPTGVPAGLVGEWQARRGSGSSYYNPNTGSYGAPNGTIDSYKFFADGRYEHAILIQNSLYNCTIRIFGRETGVAVVDGNTLTITPGPGTWEYNDNCRPHLNSKKSTQMKGQRWQWQVGRDERGMKLCARDQEGASACYYRQ